MRIVAFSHALTSCWNHGNAHFLRGVLRALAAAGHDVVSFEPRDGWSRRHLLEEGGPDAADAWQLAYPGLVARFHDAVTDPGPLVDDADLVLVHEWNEPALVAALGRRRREGGRFRLLFHDTHHRAVSDPAAMRRHDLRHYDGVLAFGEALAGVYRREGWASRVFVWHEAADPVLFHPPHAPAPDRQGAIWIGNWGDGERSAELAAFLFRPAEAARLPLTVRGVRYPADALATLRRHGVRYGGWVANTEVPALFARHRMTIHVPRRFYATALPGIPTIRVFEALACGIPLISAPWDDREALFRPGTDFLVARDEREMTAHMRTLAADPGRCAALAEAGLETVRARHTCAHRARELVAIAGELG